MLIATTTTHAHPASVAAINPHPSNSAIIRLQSSQPPAAATSCSRLEPAFQTIRPAAQVEPIAIRVPAEAQVPLLPPGLADDAGAFADGPQAFEEAQIAVGHAIFDLPESAGHRSSSVLDLQVPAGAADLLLRAAVRHHALATMSLTSLNRPDSRSASARASSRSAVRSET